jgi:hypothetical protein
MTVQEGEFTSDRGDAGIIFCSSPREEDVSPPRLTKIGNMGSKNQLPRKVIAASSATSAGFDVPVLCPNGAPFRTKLRTLIPLK